MMTIKQIQRMLRCHSYMVETPQSMFMMLIKSKVTTAENPKTIIFKIKSNGNSKTKIVVVGDWLVKYLRRKDLSSKKNNVKVITHPGSTTEDMLDYMKPIAQRKPDTLIIPTGTNDLTNGVKTMKKVRKLVKVVREIDESEKIKMNEMR